MYMFMSCSCTKIVLIDMFSVCCFYTSLLSLLNGSPISLTHTVRVKAGKMSVIKTFLTNVGRVQLFSGGSVIRPTHFNVHSSNS